MFKSDFAKIHEKAREYNEAYRKVDGVGSYETAYRKAKEEFCQGKLR